MSSRLSCSLCSSLSIFRILRIWRMILGSKPVPLASAYTSLMSSPSARFSSSSRSMRSIKDFSCAPAIPPTSGIIPSPPVVMLPPQQGRDDSLRARLAQGREANLPKPIEVWGTGEAWTGRPRERPSAQTCPAYPHRATSLLAPEKLAPYSGTAVACGSTPRSVRGVAAGDCGRDPHYWAPTGSPEAVARLRFPQNVACGFPAPRSSVVVSQLSLLFAQVSFPWSADLLIE